ncbi:response regulator [bacterium]|nr:response regulator [bacterium]
MKDIKNNIVKLVKNSEISTKEDFEKLINQIIEEKNKIFNDNQNSINQNDTDSNISHCLDDLELYKEFIKLIPIPIFEFDIYGKVTFGNEYAFSLFGYTKEDFQKGINVLDILDKKEHERQKINMMNAIQNFNSMGRKSNSYSGVKKDGTKFSFDVYYSSIVKNEKLIGFRGIVIDKSGEEMYHIAFKESEAKFKNYFEEAGIALCIVERDGEIDSMNHLFSILIGFSYIILDNNQELSKKYDNFNKIKYQENTTDFDYTINKSENINKINKINYLSLFDDDEKEHAETLFQALIDGKIKNYRLSASLKKLNGTKYYGDISANGILDGEGAVSQVILSFIDTTQQKKVSQILYQKQVQLYTILANLPIILWSVDKTGKCDFIEGKALRILDIHPSEFIGKNITENRVFENTKDGLKSALDGDTIQNVCKIEDNFFETTFVPIKDLDENIVGVSALGIDITARRELEKSLTRYIYDLEVIKEQQEEYNALMKSILESPEDIMIFAINREYEITLFNKVYSNYIKKRYGIDIYYKMNLFQIPFSKDEIEIIRNHIEWVFLREESFIFIDNYDSSENSNFNSEKGDNNTIQNSSLKDGNLYYEVRYHPVKTDDNRLIGVTCFQINITNQIMLMDEMVKSKEEAEIANQSKSIFLANMSHEIRTPLNAIQGFSQLLESLITDEKQRYYIDSIKSSGKTLLTLLNDILDLSKIESKKLEIHWEAVNIIELLLDIKNTFSLHAVKKGLSLSITIQKGLPSVLLLDETRVRQILGNLLSNAIKFTEKGFVHIEVQFEIFQDNTLDLIIKVNDSGIGIPSSQLERIFKPFEQYENQINRKYEGSGLGLSICNQLVSLMNGSISVNSKINEGSSFTILLNKIKITQKELKQTSFNENKEIQFQDSIILLVEDLDLNRKLIREFLDSYKNLIVLEAYNGEEALFMLEKYENIDLVLMDLKMPIMDGFEALKHIRLNEKTKDLPVIALSAYALKTDLDKIKKAGFNEFMSKPVDKNGLLKLICNYIKHDYKDVTEIKIEKKTQKIDGSDEKLEENTVFSKDIIDELKNRFLPWWSRINKNRIVDDIENFSLSLKKFSEQNQISSLKDFANGLYFYANQFDIEKIDFIMKFFPKLLKKIEENSN